jgi:hypothetical protein
MEHDTFPLDDLRQALDDLDTALAAAPGSVDVTPVQAAVDDLKAALPAKQEAL